MIQTGYFRQIHEYVFPTVRALPPNFFSHKAREQLSPARVNIALLTRAGWGEERLDERRENGSPACLWWRRWLSCLDGRPRCTGPLVPPLNVHADYEEPQDQKWFREGGDGSDVGKQRDCERR